MTAEDLFPGAARPLPAPSRQRAGFLISGPVDIDDLPPELREALAGPVTHAAGYGSFADAVEDAGADALSLARDVDALVAFLGAHTDVLAEPAVRDAAGIFLGNALAVFRPGADWRVPEEREVGTTTRSIAVDRVVELIAADPRRAADFLQSLGSWAADDEAASRRAAAQRRGMDSSGPGLEYPDREFVLRAIPDTLDDAGVPYGERRGDAFPDDWYSRVSHPERFAPLHAVAEDLIAYLAREYDVTVDDERAADGTGSVRVQPASGAALELEFTGFPGVLMRAGAGLRGTYPDCGCDACDESGPGEAENLATEVLAVAAGGLTEIRVDDDVVTSLRHPSGSRGGGGGDRPDPAALELVADLPDGHWPVWPRRR